MILILCGKSGCGKDTLFKKLVNEDHLFSPIISTTTRPMRKGEKEGREYYFTDEATFKSRNDEWIECFGDTVKLLVLIGQTREKIAECAKKHGFTNYVFKDTYEEALEFCTRSAEPGDAVLLSPACASWDMFPNYETRGKRFKEYVNKLSD